jgi:hypothetical protein
VHRISGDITGMKVDMNRMSGEIRELTTEVSQLNKKLAGPDSKKR